MKVFLKLYMAFILTSLLIISCKGDDEKSLSVPSITMKINGNNWTASPTPVALLHNGLIIRGQVSNADFMELRLNGSALGTYILDDGGENGVGYQKDTEFFPLNDDYGPGASIELIEFNINDGTVSGTFSFSQTNLVDGSEWVFSEGEFNNIPLQSYQDKDAGNYLNCLIDSTISFEAATISGFDRYGYLNIQGFTADYQQSIGINVSSDVTPGTYVYEEGSPIWAGYLPDPETSLGSQKGTLIITEHDLTNRNITGSFEFEAVPHFQGNASVTYITEGVFSVAY